MTILKCIVTTLQVHMVFNLSYCCESNNTWVFLQRTLLRVKTEFDKRSPCVSSLSPYYTTLKRVVGSGIASRQNSWWAVFTFSRRLHTAHDFTRFTTVLLENSGLGPIRASAGMKWTARRGAEGACSFSPKHDTFSRQREEREQITVKREQFGEQCHCPPHVPVLCNRGFTGRIRRRSSDERRLVLASYWLSPVYACSHDIL